MGTTRAVVVLGLVAVLLTGSGAVVATPVVSLDGDGIPALQELQAGTDPLSTDTDDDGLGDGTEREEGTDPSDADTDGDGLADGPEVTDHGTDPLAVDTDGDGLEDGTEVDGPTDPLALDTDGDDIDDATEVASETDPADADTDDDGLGDRRERDALGTDPTAADTDGDGIDDRPEGEQYGTDPTAIDTDGDGLEDGTEVDGPTNPTEADTDDDGLDDGAELNEYDTDPTVADVDGDGIPDGMDVRVAHADPHRMDVLVEVDYMAGDQPPFLAFEKVEQAYANAPIENPDGSTGIHLHVRVDSRLPAQSTTSLSDATALMDDHFDSEADGYRYAVAVRDARTDGGANLGGVARCGGSGEFIFQLQSRYRANVPADLVGSTFMHELGHSLGLCSNDYRGIDSHEVSYDDYPSTMNYNAPYWAMEYSDGEGFDDWEYLADHMEPPPGA